MVGLGVDMKEELVKSTIPTAGVLLFKEQHSTVQRAWTLVQILQLTSRVALGNSASWGHHFLVCKTEHTNGYDHFQAITQRALS